MKTVFTVSPDEAADHINRGGVAAFPTETVYGLGANIFDERAVAKIFEAKRRPADNPLIAHIAVLAQLDELAVGVNDPARKFIDAFFPGPLTLVLERHPNVPLTVTAGLDTVGIRMPRLEIAHRFLKFCNGPVAAPSANLSGRPSPTTWQAVAEDLNGRIDCILQANATEIGIESTVVDCTSTKPQVLRSGSVSIEQLREIVPATMPVESGGSRVSRSPGVLHQHYAPRARVELIEIPAKLTGRTGSAFIGLNPPGQLSGPQRVCSSVDEYAHSIFEFFRECDRCNVTMIYCEIVEEAGIGAALMDRIKRAAAR